ncbi:rCG42853 [Rattus norvegicus]|uniref:RCG42853 n=1 Tax=Rattus norvegicus TaxID=10116 RepID=A6JZU9_RAT|nr:rCG42853 [Rattus norvegicus]
MTDGHFDMFLDLPCWNFIILASIFISFPSCLIHIQYRQCLMKILVLKTS